MNLKHWLAFLFCAVAWSASFLWIKLALREISPELVAAYRVTVGLAVGTLLMAIMGQSWPRSWREWKPYAILGVTNLALPYYLLAVGEQTIDSAIASILNATTPLFTIVFATVVLHDDKLTFRRFIGLLVGFAGVWVLLSKDIPSDTRNSVIGELLTLGSAACYGASVVYMRHSTRNAKELLGGIAPLLSATVASWMVIGLTGGEIQIPVLTVTWIALLWLGALGACVALVLYFYLVHEIGPTRASLVTYVLPPAGVVLGVIFLDEPVTWNLITGSALILLSLIVVNARQRPR